MVNKPKYFQLEPTAFLSDVDFQMMTAQERGVYFTVILYLYANGGAMGSNIGTLQALCNYGHDMLGWEQMWGNIKHKFKINNNGFITHKRVSKEMQESGHRMQVAKESGLKGAEKRWGAHSNPKESEDRVPIAKVSKGKVSKEKVSNGKYTSNSEEIRLASLLFDLMVQRKPDHKKPDLQSWAKHIDLMIRIDNRTTKKIEAVIRWSQQDSFWQNNILSTLKLRKHFDELEMKSNERKTGTNSQQSNQSQAESVNSSGEFYR